MLELFEISPAMKKILVSGNNKIAEFVHNFLPLRGYEVIDITQLSAFQDNLSQLKDAECILDLNNTETHLTDSNTEYDPEFVKELIDLAKTIKTGYVFAYQEAETSETEGFLINTLDFVDDYCNETNTPFSKILIGDIYGTELTTSQKLKDILGNIVEEKPIYVEEDTKDYYLINQTDFIEGLEEVIKIFKNNKSLLKTYTLLPEEPLTEIELVHFIQDLNELEIEINYTNESAESVSTISDLSMDVNYPGNWYPKVDLEQGMKALMTSYGIPVLGTAAEELAEEEFLLNEDRDFETFDDPLISMWDETTENDFDRDSDEQYSFISSDDDGISKQAIKTKKATNRKHQKAKVIALTTLLLIAAAAPSIIYKVRYSQAKSLIAESIYHLKTANLAMAQEKSQSAINKLNTLNTNSFFTKLAFFKEDHQQALESSAKIVSYLADNFQFSDQNQVLGTNTYSGIDKSFEMLNLLESDEKALINNPEIAEILKSKDLLKNLKEINPTLEQVLGFNSVQKYLILFVSENNSKSFGNISYYALLELKEGKYTVNKINKIDELNALIALNSNSSIENLTSLIGEEINLEDSLKKTLNVFNFVNTEKVDGLLYITPSSIPELNNNMTFDSEDEAKNYVNHLLSFSSSNLETLVKSFVNNTSYVYFRDESINIPYRKNNWTGKLSTIVDDSVSIVSKASSDNELIKSISFTGENTEEIYKRTLSLSLENPSDKESIETLEIVLPKDSMLTQALLSENGANKNITRTFGLNVKGANIIYKTDILLNPYQKSVLEINYESSGKDKQDGYLTFGFENNPGINNLPITISFNYPAGIPNTTRIPENMQINNNSIEFKGNLNQHLILSAPL